MQPFFIWFISQKWSRCHDYLKVSEIYTSPWVPRRKTSYINVRNHDKNWELFSLIWKGVITYILKFKTEPIFYLVSWNFLKDILCFVVDILDTFVSFLMMTCLWDEKEMCLLNHPVKIRCNHERKKELRKNLLNWQNPSNYLIRFRYLSLAYFEGIINWNCQQKKIQCEMFDGWTVIWNLTSL